MMKDIFKEERLFIIEYVPFRLLNDDLYKEIVKGSKVSLFDEEGILVEKIIKRM